MGGQAEATSPLDAVDIIFDLNPGLWMIAIAFFGFGDFASTAIALSFQRPVEAGPVTSIAIDLFGLPIAIPLKLLTLALAYLLWRLAPPPQNIGVPLGLSALGVGVTIWNVSILLVVL